MIRRGQPTRARAVLYLHGWSDYFFQAHLGDEMDGLGYDFYAVDLRRYGRSLRSRQLAGYVAKLDDYFVELDAALEVLRDEGHDDIVLMGHSTGGLLACLYANERPGAFSALILNSPWLELQANPMLRSTTQPMFSAVGAVAPTTALPRADGTIYHRSISADADGEWVFNHNLKGDPAFLVRVGWLSAILQGHARVASGLDIDCPILLAVSKRTDFRRSWDESLLKADTVLDVERIAERVTRLGDLVVLTRIHDGLHDLVLSAPEVRTRVFLEYGRFLSVYAN
ncbi:alpha/beta hydrolase [Tessaracoccus sp. HDW20]|uniref:alpha/beta hydrolase n=1 Tax=Tessaracoccus coleopterorum TaxID=2714950 RepID=UPI0018D29638|nr:alpha/beta hydrolase [Tessaracoccus coleopterorum]